MVLFVSIWFALFSYVPINNYFNVAHIKQTCYQSITNYLNTAYLKQINDPVKENLGSKSAKKKLLLTVGVLSKLSATERRLAIRTTWFKVCKDNVDKVVCRFFTDLPKKYQGSYYDEEIEYNDVEYMPFQGLLQTLTYR